MSMATANRQERGRGKEDGASQVHTNTNQLNVKPSVTTGKGEAWVQFKMMQEKAV